MESTVTMLLSKYEQLQEQAKERWERLEKVNRALKLVYQIEIEDLLRRTSEIEDSKNRMSIRDAVMSGKF